MDSGNVTLTDCHAGGSRPDLSPPLLFDTLKVPCGKVALSHFLRDSDALMTEKTTCSRVGEQVER